MADEFGNVTVPTPLVTLQQVKDQLRLTGTQQDAIATFYAALAQDEILSYLKGWADPAWTETTVPKPVKAQILRRTTFLYEDRGDDMKKAGGSPDSAEANWKEITRALDRFRDPALA
jgi:hypothetical protein